MRVAERRASRTALASDTDAFGNDAVASSTVGVEGSTVGEGPSS